MAINTGDSITAADYNSLQSRVQQVLGQGSQTFGYGQQVKSQQVSGPTATGESNATNITAEEFNNIRDDISRIFIHQTGSALDVGLFKGAGSADNNFQTADEADVIGADQSATSVTVDNSDNYTYTNTDETKGFNNLVEIVSQIESQQNRFKIDSTQQQLQMLEIDRRTNAWNGSIQSEIEVTFTDADQRRYFFNAGGQLRFQGIVTAVSSQRGSFWNDLIENPSGLYGDSFWQIEAREQTSSSISFRITLVNDGPEGDFDAGDPGSIAGGIQESVAADIEFEYSAMKASGTVVTQFPTINLINSFS